MIKTGTFDFKIVFLMGFLFVILFVVFVVVVVCLFVFRRGGGGVERIDNIH